MDSVLTLCLVFLSGLMAGALIGAATIAICFSSKSHDKEFEHESNAAPYPRYYE